MNTFLPYPNFEKSARCLDNRRLGKQRIEVLTILRVLNDEVQGWRNHPAVLMWHGYTEALVEYGCAICDEWIRRGCRDNCRWQIVAHSWGSAVQMPQWFGRADFHRSHQSNLLRKDPQFYRRFKQYVPPDLPYVWPVTKKSVHL